MIKVYSVLLPILVLVFFENAFTSRAAELISTYSKVARYGPNNGTSPGSEARSNGQSLWPQRIDSGFKKPEPLRPVYYYTPKPSSSKIDTDNIDSVPAKGEVEERFNPRPYFDFVFDDSPKQNKPNSKNPSYTKPKPPALVYGTPSDLYSSQFSSYNPPDDLKTAPVDTLNVPSNNNQSNVPKSNSKKPLSTKPKPATFVYAAPADLYSSPFSSYNPPNQNPDDSKDILEFPPNDNQQPVAASTTTKRPEKKPPVDVYSSPFDSYNPPNQNPNDFIVSQENTFNYPPNNQPPLTLQHMKKKPDKGPLPTSYGVPDLQSSKAKPDSDNLHNHNHYLPPTVDNKPHRPPFIPTQKPTKPYFMDDSDSDEISDTFPEYQPPVMQTPMPPSQAKPENPPKNNAPPMPSMAEDDLSPPPEDIPYGKFPQYIDHDPHNNDFYHFHHGHDVYHEVHTTVPTTTSTEAPRAGHYSYYYLGRKLWYIPLYFSVYFIVYVTVLILKSIARHKIQFSHYFDKGRSARQLELDVLNQTVITAIEESENKYM